MTSETNKTSLTLEEAFNLAVEHYQQGEKETARNIFEQVLVAAPDSLPVLQVLSVLDMEDHAFNAAEAKLRHAQSLAPQDLSLQLDLAIAIKAQGRNKEALLVLEDLLSADPANVSALQLRQELTALMGQRGASQRDKKQLDVIQQQKKLQFDKEIDETLKAIDTLMAQHHNVQAEQLILAVLALDENNIATLQKWVQLLMVQDKNVEAAHQLKRLLQLDPTDDLAAILLSKAYARLKDYRNGRIVCQDFIRHAGEHPQIEKQWFVMCVKDSHWIQGEQLGKSLIQRFPDDNDIIYMYAVCCFQLLRTRYNYTIEAMQHTLEYIDKAKVGASDKRYTELSRYQIEVTWYFGEITKVEQLIKQVLTSNPDDDEIIWLSHYIHLHRNQWEQYYPTHELGTTNGKRLANTDKLPRWTIEHPLNEHLLVLPEQGVGDEIRNYHNLSFLLRYTDKLYVACDARLVPLLEQAFPTITYIPQQRISDNHEIIIPAEIGQYITSWIPVGSIGAEIYRKEGKHWDSPHYAVFPSELKQHWQDKVDAQHSGSGLKIGISWRSGLGSASRNINFLKTHEVAHFIKQFPDATFYNLQYGECSKELKKIEKLSGVKVIQLEGLDLRDDFLATAAVMDSLDVVFTAPTAVHMLTVTTTTPCYVYGAGSNESNFAEPTEYFGDMDEKQEFLFRFPPLMANKYPMIEAISQRIKTDLTD
ncbi:tetratricopeptide repeat protein [Photobacterium kagoshimensis]|uniref:tetratricopeptide repeat protein n=1 Tax=Photobacterium kagoshimensis TaxID=2910242 RepID=UPI003D12468D